MKPEERALLTRCGLTGQDIPVNSRGNTKGFKLKGTSCERETRSRLVRSRSAAKKYIYRQLRDNRMVFRIIWLIFVCSAGETPGSISISVYAEMQRLIKAGHLCENALVQGSMTRAEVLDALDRARARNRNAKAAAKAAATKCQDEPKTNARKGQGGARARNATVAAKAQKNPQSDAPKDLASEPKKKRKAPSSHGGTLPLPVHKITIEFMASSAWYMPNRDMTLRVVPIHDRSDLIEQETKFQSPSSPWRRCQSCRSMWRFRIALPCHES